MDTYISQQKQQLLDSLENQVRFSQLVAVLVGDKGLGKTFLLDQLLERISEEVLLARIDASMAMSEDQLAKTISLQLGLSWNNPDIGLEQQIKTNLNQKVLILLDNAHLLSASCIDYLLRLNQAQLSFPDSVLFILMAGENSLPKIISQSDIYTEHQEMCVVFQIEPIQLNETKALSAAFGHDDLVDGFLDDKKLNYFWQLSKGNPAELNYHISRWIEEKKPSEVVEITDAEKMSYLKSFVYVVISFSLMITLFFQDSINQWISGDKTDPNEISKLKGIDKSESLSKQKLQKVSSQQDRKTKKENFTVGSEKIKQKSEDPLDRKLSESGADDTGSKQSDVLSKMKKTSDKLSNLQAVPNSSVHKTASNKIDIKPHQNIDSKPKLTNDENKLLKENGNYFSLQWTGVSSLESAKDFKEKHLLNSKMKIYRRVNKKKVLYLVISGIFQTKEKAEQTRNDYKKMSIKETPWIKSISSIQAEIEEFIESRR